MNDATFEMVKARANLVIDNPFFGSLALRLKMQEDLTCDTIWTDGHTLGFNPEFILKLRPEERRGVLAHEVMHLANAHHIRRQSRDPKKWNIAADMAINPLLRDAGLRLPDGVVYGNGDKSAEQEYADMPDGGSGGGGDGDGSGSGDDTGGNDPGGCGEIRDFSGESGDGQPTQSEMQSEEEGWKIAVTQAAQQAKAMGKLPGALEGFVEELLEHKVPWTEVLRNFLERAAKNDYNWNRPNRRYLQAGFVLPSLHSNELGEIVVAVDTSESVWRMKDQFASELSGLLESFPGAKIHIIYCDSRIRGVETVEELPIELHPKGGGGTSFIPVFDYVEEEGMTPTCLVYLTDMMGTFPEDGPEYPVIWVDTLGHREDSPFGEYVRMEAE